MNQHTSFDQQDIQCAFDNSANCRQLYFLMYTDVLTDVKFASKNENFKTVVDKWPVVSEAFTWCFKNIIYHLSFGPKQSRDPVMQYDLLLELKM